MKKVCVTLVAGLIAVGMLSRQASAIPPLHKAFMEKYTDVKLVEAAKETKCNVCHDPNSKEKKDKNEYGKALGKFFKKGDFGKLKDKPEEATKYANEAFDKAEAEKDAAGKTFGDKIKAGTLPGS